jgi:hypothetical protein
MCDSAHTTSRISRKVPDECESSYLQCRPETIRSIYLQGTGQFRFQSLSQGDFVEKGGWATVPESNPATQVTAVAQACALLLAGA